MASKSKVSKKKDKKRQKSKKNSSVKNLFFYGALVFVSIFLIFSYFNYDSNSSSNLESAQKNDKSTKILMDKMRSMLEHEKKRLKEAKAVSSEKEDIVYETKTLIKEQKNIKKSKNGKNQKKASEEKSKKEPKKVQNNYLSEIKDYEKSLKHGKKNNSAKSRKKTLVEYNGKPKLAIIIDDVSFQNQIKLLHRIPYKINPSFFPPTRRHPKTDIFAKEFSFALVHLPMEALNYVHPEPDTLLVGDSREIIKRKIESIKRKFPQIKYYNNHTGSRFTSDIKSMKLFLEIMDEEGLVFVDSRTTADTKAPVIFHAKHRKLLSRDVFLDNSIKPKDILKQLKTAVKIAKKHGFAIAIGHPHTNTLKTLINAKPYLKDVQTVYLNEL